MVEISVGTDDGVRKGHKFVVTRPSTGKYIGIIEVIHADSPNRSVCRPDKASANDQIQKGDHVKAYTKPAKAAASQAASQEYRKPRADVYTVLLVVALLILLVATAALWMR